MFALEPAEESQGQTHCAAWNERHPCSSHPPESPLKVLKVVEITSTLRAGTGTASPADSPENHALGSQEEQEQGNPSSRRNTVGCFLLAMTGRDHFPRKLLRFMCRIFFPFALCGESESGGIWQLRSISAIVIPWQKGFVFRQVKRKGVVPFWKNIELKRPVGKYIQIACMTLLLKFLGWGSTSQQNNVLARYVHFAKLLSTVQRNHQSWCSDATESFEKANWGSPQKSCP